MTVYPRCAVCIGIVGFARQHDRRLVPAAAGHIASFTTADYLRKVLLAAEQNLDIFVQTAAAIEAGVDNDAFAIVVFTQNIRVNGTEAVIAHRLDMHIAQTAARPFGYICRALFYPTGVEQSV